MITNNQTNNAAHSASSPPTEAVTAAEAHTIVGGRVFGLPLVSRGCCKDVPPPDDDNPLKRAKAPKNDVLYWIRGLF
jgi:hypothetical protein